VIAPLTSGLMALDILLNIFSDQTNKLSTTLTIISFTVFLIFFIGSCLVP
jgi:hypothetical protein